MSFDINKPYRTRDGREAQAFPYKANHIGAAFVGGYRDSTGCEWAAFWDAQGRHVGSSQDGPTDLVNIPEKRTVKVWINAYDGQGISDSAIHESRWSADRLAMEGRIACIEREITYEIGEGL